jgi:hypothetical protein
MSAALPAGTEQLALVAALRQRTDGAGTSRLGMSPVLSAHKGKCCRMNSERETPRSRAARESSRSSSGSNAIVVAFFLESAREVI